MQRVMQRVMVIGSGGAGKSTLAEQIAERASLPLVRLDALYWRAGWVETPKPEWTAMVAELAAGDRWVMDGNYGGTMDVRLARADTVIFLDLPRIVCLWGILSRWLRYRGRTRPDLAPGCPEQMNWEFIVWVWQYPSRRRGEVLARLARLRDATVVILRSRAEVRTYLSVIPTSARTASGRLS